MLRLLFLFFSINFLSFSNVEYKITSVARTYPTGALLNVEGGETYKFWAKDNHPFLFGFVRPSFNFKTSALINELGAKLEVAPVSFIKLYYERAFGDKRPKKLKSYDCALVRCSFSYDKDTYGLKMAMKLKKYFFLWDFGNFKTTSKYKDKFFIEEKAQLLGKGGNDTLIQNVLIFGKEMNKKWNLSILNILSSMDKLGNSTRMHSLLIQYKKSEHTYAFAGGVFVDRFKKSRASIVLMYNFISDNSVSKW